MRIGPLSFAPRLLTTLAAGAAIALTGSLGRWQVDRAAEKRDRQQLLDARTREAPVRLGDASARAEDLLFRRLEASGTWMPQAQIFVDNTIHNGKAGFRVVTPLQLDGAGGVVLVDRGWAPRSADYPRAPAVPAPTGRAEVRGLGTLPPARVLELSAQTVSGNVWQNLSVARFRERTGLAVLPVVLSADIPGPGLVAIRERPDAGVAKHQEYALTWFSLAATVLVLWIALNLKRAR